jgi:sigma-E factor negative regulatory protein RseA
MNTKRLAQERISVFADGETSDQQLDIALAELRGEEGKETWGLYHHIGDFQQAWPRASLRNLRW